MLVLRGSGALSDFRRARLLATLQTRVPGLADIRAEYVHLVSHARPLDEEQRQVLDRLLDYGQALPEDPLRGHLLLTIPRIGTRSSWSSKATDVARICGLHPVQRIERGIAYYLRHGEDRALTPEETRAAAALLHDRMVETVVDSLDAAAALFERAEPAPLATVDILAGGEAALQEANARAGFSLSPEEITYLVERFRQLGRNPSDAELMMFAQVNSEHCRHKIFNAEWWVDGERQADSLFAMIRRTTEKSPAGVLSAYHDNASVIEGGPACRFLVDPVSGEYRAVDEDAHILLKVETHNHPTAISPFPGAATGAGGEIRDEGATGRGAKPKAGVCGFSVSDLRLPGYQRPWERDNGKPDRLASALDIMVEGPIGAASFNNEFGRPNLGGYFRTLEIWTPGVEDPQTPELRGYHKPIMIAGGVGSVRPDQVLKKNAEAGARVVVLGGPAMLIGLGGGSASSVASGAGQAELDFASVQRSNPEMQRRCQEVIDRCWALGEDSPILAIHDVGAGGLSNALPELVHDSGLGAHFELRDIPSDDPGMSPMQIWSNEAQERYVLTIAPERLATFEALCQRERCPYAVVGEATADGELVVGDRHFDNRPVDMPMDLLFADPPRMRREAQRLPRRGEALDVAGLDLQEAALRVLRLPAVAAKQFLITIGDRTVSGLVARDQLVGPWQMPVADVAVTLADYRGYRGEAMAMGERTPTALLDAAASVRMAVGEAITNIAAADIDRLSDVKLSANWMAAAGQPGEDAALFDGVRAVSELCQSLGLAIPVGKDSLSMTTVWEEQGEARKVTAPLSLIVTGAGPVADARRTLTPQLRLDAGDTALLLVDLAGGRQRLGGSALAQVHGVIGEAAPDLERPEALSAFFHTLRSLTRDGRILAYHDRSDGGLFATVCEMAFAARCGVSVDLAPLGGDAIPALFNEELGAVLQVRAVDVDAVRQAFADAGLSGAVQAIGAPNDDDMIRIVRDGETLLEAPRTEYLSAWWETSYAIQALRDNPDCAREEFDAILDGDNPGLQADLSFDPSEDVAAPYITAGARPRVAILREQGVNGQIEMAAAFDRAGFTAVDVHMTDLLDGERTLDEFHGLVAGGGFSYGDVLGAGEGWAKTILFHERTRDRFADFFRRPDTFALGVCNGCQMLSTLQEIIPSTEGWPRFKRNRSEQFEARLLMVEIPESPSLFFRGMAGSRLPVAIAHGEGRAEFPAPDGHARAQAEGWVALRYVDGAGRPATRYPANPGGSPEGITGVCSRDGRVTILMPHPERVFRTVQHSWHPDEWGEDGPWLRMFRNARVWVG